MQLQTEPLCDLRLDKQDISNSNIPKIIGIIIDQLKKLKDKIFSIFQEKENQHELSLCATDSQYQNRYALAFINSNKDNLINSKKVDMKPLLDLFSQSSLLNLEIAEMLIYHNCDKAVFQHIQSFDKKYHLDIIKMALNSTESVTELLKSSNFKKHSIPEDIAKSLWDLGYEDFVKANKKIFHPIVEKNITEKIYISEIEINKIKKSLELIFNINDEETNMLCVRTPPSKNSSI